MEAGPVDQPNIGQEAPRVRAPDIEVFLLSAYYQKSQNRRNPLKAKFRVVRVCKIPHPYKDRIDRLVAQVEGPNAVLGNPATYRGQVLRLLCNLLFPLEASYISDQLLSYRVLRSISSANLPLLVRMGLSTEVTLARNQRGQLCQYIKVFFLSELIYQRRIRCKEDKIAELVPYEETEFKKLPAAQQLGFMSDIMKQIYHYLPYLTKKQVPKSHLRMTPSQMKHNLEFIRRLSHPVQFRFNFLTESVTVVKNPELIPPEKMPIVLETKTDTIENGDSAGNPVAGLVPLLGSQLKHYHTDRLWTVADLQVITSTKLTNDNLVDVWKRSWFFVRNRYTLGILTRGAEIAAAGEINFADVLNQINANTTEAHYKGQFARGIMGAVGFFYEGIKELDLHFQKLGSQQTHPDGATYLKTALQHLFKHLLSAADCLDQYITHFFSFRDRDQFLATPFALMKTNFDQLRQFQMHLVRFVQSIVADEPKHSELASVTKRLIASKDYHLERELGLVASAKIVDDPKISQDLALVNNLPDSYIQKVHLARMSPVPSSEESFHDSVTLVSPALRATAHLELFEVIADALAGRKYCQQQIKPLPQFTLVDLKGRPLGIWNHKTKNLIRYKNKLLGFDCRRIFCSEIVQSGSNPADIVIQATPYQFGNPGNHKQTVGVWNSRMYYFTQHTALDFIKAVDLKQLQSVSDSFVMTQGAVNIIQMAIHPSSVCLRDGLLGFVEKTYPASQGKICILKLNPETGLSVSETNLSLGSLKLAHARGQGQYKPEMEIFGARALGSGSRYVIIAFKQHSDRNHTSFNRSLQLLRYNPGSDNLEFLDGFQDTYYKTGSRTIFFEKNRVPFVLEFNFHSSVLHGVSKDNKLVKVSDNPLKKIPLLDWPNKQWTIRYHLKDAVGLPQKTDSSGLLHIAIRGSQLDGQSSLRIYSVKLQM